MKTLFIFLGGLILFTETSNSQCLSIDNFWQKYYNGTAVYRDAFLDMKVSSNSGHVYVTGQTSTDGGAGLDYVTIKYNSNGNLIWTRKYDGPRSSEDISYSIAIDDSDNVYITGTSWGEVGQSTDYATIKYDSSGNVKWIDRYNGTSGGSDYAYSIFIDSAGYVYVTGSGRENNGHTQDIVTIKYNRGGSRIWTAKYDLTDSDFGTKVIVDNSGNVYVAGYTSGAGTAKDCLTLKYNSSGILQWARKYDYIAHGNDEPSDIALDPQGNVYVTGTSVGFVGTQFSTIKYSASGDSLWNNIYFFVGQGNESNAMHVDSLGNVYVTGYTRVAVISNSNDYLTLKYNTNGVTQAIKRYNGPADASDIATSIIPGPNGKLFVGGGSTGLNGDNEDFVIIEYDMNTMEECFVSRYSYPSANNINALALDRVRGILYACGETATGEGSGDGMTARYCLTAPSTLVYTVKAAIEGLYNISSNRHNIRDTVRGYLRSNISPYSVVASSNAVVDSVTLSMTQLFNNMSSGDYYLVMTHRNSIETWSRSGGELFSCGSSLNYDFTNSISKAFGANMKLADTSPIRYVFYTGDVDQDGVIDGSDGLLVENASANFLSGYVREDCNGDYFVDGTDAVFVDNNSFNFVTKITP